MGNFIALVIIVGLIIFFVNAFMTILGRLKTIENVQILALAMNINPDATLKATRLDHVVENISRRVEAQNNSLTDRAVAFQKPFKQIL